MKKRQSKYIITLSTQEKNRLKEITQKGKHSARAIKRARVLLKSESGLADREIADQIDSAISTVERIRYRFFKGGIEKALYDAPRSGQPEKLSAKVEAHLIAVACSDPPQGRTRWTLELLRKQIIKDKKVKTISTVAIWKHLRNRGIKPWLEKNVVYSRSYAGIYRENGECS